MWEERLKISNSNSVPTFISSTCSEGSVVEATFGVGEPGPDNPCAARYRSTSSVPQSRASPVPREPRHRTTIRATVRRRRARSDGNGARLEPIVVGKDLHTLIRTRLGCGPWAATATLEPSSQHQSKTVGRAGEFQAEAGETRGFAALRLPPGGIGGPADAASRVDRGGQMIDHDETGRKQGLASSTLAVVAQAPIPQARGLLIPLPVELRTVRIQLGHPTLFAPGELVVLQSAVVKPQIIEVTAVLPRGRAPACSAAKVR